MKKIIAIVLSILTLTLVCTGCKPKVDPYEGLYGVYNMVESGTEVYNDGEWLITGVPYDVAVYIENTKAQTGKTITITKEKLKFSGGSIELEIDYRIPSIDYIYFDNTIEGGYFPFDKIRVDSFEIKTPTVYQFVTYDEKTIDGKLYIIYFFYLK